MPALGFGTYASDRQDRETYAAVISALEAGYRHLDCAWYYLNEDEVGDALSEWLSKNLSVKRQDIFVTTKVWPHLYEPKDIEWSLNNSLQMLKLDYVDCFLLHWPFAAEKTEDNHVKTGPDGKYIIKKALTENPKPIWRTMEKLYKAGKAKCIGVSNWTIPGLDAMLDYAEIKPAINQVEIHPYFSNGKLIQYCRAQDIMPVAYSPLGSQGQSPTTGEKITTDSELNGIAKKKNVSLAQVLIAWGIQRGYAVLPKSSNRDRIFSNAQLITLSPEEFEAINKIAKSKHIRFVNLKNTFGYDVWPGE